MLINGSVPSITTTGFACSPILKVYSHLQPRLSINPILHPSTSQWRKTPSDADLPGMAVKKRTGANHDTEALPRPHLRGNVFLKDGERFKTFSINFGLPSNMATFIEKLDAYFFGRCWPGCVRPHHPLRLCGVILCSRQPIRLPRQPSTTCADDKAQHDPKPLDHATSIPRYHRR